MTVREAVSVLKDADTIKVEWNGQAVPLVRNDPIMLDAYGSYKVHSISGFKPDPQTDAATEYEISLAVAPIREPAV